MVKDIICVACPMGCQISVELSDSGEILSVTGNTCKRGDAYARTECTNPERSLTTTVKVSGGDLIVTYDDDGVRLTGNAELAFTGVTTY